ncbi:MAG: hypothetical protein J1E43_11345 [Christensenellaceae bacterium]|nr:hypothetical protein [Christensenellaceae bacterium]
MKKIKWILAFTLLFMVVTLGASADVARIERQPGYLMARNYVLRNGDELHWLTISYDSDMIDSSDESGWTMKLSMDANCQALRDGAFVPCESHCADRWCGERVFKSTELVRITCQDPLNGMAVSPQNRTYMIDWNDDLYLWNPEEADPWQYLCTLDSSQVPYDGATETYSASDDGYLYTCYTITNDNGYLTEGTAFAYSLQTGAGEKICTMPVLHAVYPASGNQLLILGDTAESLGARWLLYDTITRKTTYLNQFVSRGSPIADGDTGWYSVYENAVYRFGEDGSKETVAEIPKNNHWAFTMSDDKTTVYCYNPYDSNPAAYLYIYSLNISNEDHTLVLAGSMQYYGYPTNSLPDMDDFYAENPGVEIKTLDYPATFDDIALELLTGSDRFDIIVMDCSIGNLQSLLEKGFYVDLSGDESISSFVNNTYPVWRDKCVYGDSIAAFPIGARDIWSFIYDPDVWAEESMGPVPTTYDELFDRIVAWDEQGLLDSYPLFYFYSGLSSFDRLFNRIMLSYIGKCMREGTPIVFENETLLRLLNRLNEIRPILQAHDARNISGIPLVPEGSFMPLIHRSGGSGSYDNTQVCEPLPIGIDSVEDSAESVFLTVLIVNPKSTRIELAKKYLAYAAEHPSVWAQCALLRGTPDGVRETGYEDISEQYEQLLPELQEKLDAAARVHDEAVMNAVEAEISELTGDYENQWIVRPQMAEKLYRMMPYFSVLTSDGYGFLEKNADLTDMFSANQMDALTLVKRLDERMQMMRLEGI